ncbi:hypothetical protein EUGRSUZ_H03797 [Eucalyptus grandis]|uniref:Uncharacterized protein n=2 Tax=Eucalyptus grandis TaxID=71139 RepID=A0ACC3JW08_EUCGR|nr:hypothetical protein EUGRSUZ_H03797 [Eucalyptus grandis]
MSPQFPFTILGQQTVHPSVERQKLEDQGGKSLPNDEIVKSVELDVKFQLNVWQFFPEQGRGIRCEICSIIYNVFGG